MENKNALVSGASMAGPALAYWLNRYGFEVTVVERAPMLREGGFAVDFRGEAHMGVPGRMGILEAVRRQQTNMGEQVSVDEMGRSLASLPAHCMSGEVEIRRGDLSRILYEATRDHTEYIFGDSISTIAEGDDGVHVAFESGLSRDFDLVVGADGLHYNVRRLAFGDESKFMRFFGYYLAFFNAPNRLNLDHRGCSTTCRGSSRKRAVRGTTARPYTGSSSPPGCWTTLIATSQSRSRSWRTPTQGWVGRSPAW